MSVSKWFAWSLCVVMLLVQSCQPNVSAEAAEAEKVLRSFLEDLHAGRYDLAASRYAPEDDVLTGMNPDLEPGDMKTLLQRACTQNGFMCLLPDDELNVVRSSQGEFVFSVGFILDDGTRFERGPCCGEESVEPPQSAFDMCVRCDAGRCLVLDLPPYVP